MHVRVNRAAHTTEKRSRFFIACVTQSHVHVNIAIVSILLEYSQKSSAESSLEHTMCSG